MRPSLASAISLAFFTSCSLGQATPPSGGGHGIQFLPKDRKPPVGPAMDDESLKKLQQTTKAKGFLPEEAQPKGWDLMANSEFIAYDGVSTLLPKGSILHVPETMKKHIAPGPAGKLMVWNEFATRYRGLVSSFEITIEQASGQAQIDPVRLDAARKTGLIVVAMHNGHPISVAVQALPAVTAKR